jgi:isopentenyldiphosphate isomerase
MIRVVRLPCTAGQDEDGAWCASAPLRPGVSAAGGWPTRETAIADLRAGGAIDLGESVAQAAIREAVEESGITCHLTGLVGIYSDPRHRILYTCNGEVRQEFSIVLTARQVSGTPTPSDELTEVRWVPANDLPGYTMDRSMRIRINDYLRGDSHPVVT